MILNLHAFILKLYKNKQNCLVSSRIFSISYSKINLTEMSLKMGKFENFITQFTKVKLEKNVPSTFHLSNWEIIRFVKEQEKVKMLLYGVIYLYFNTTALKKSCFISSEGLDFHMTDNLLIAVHAFHMCM